MQIITKTYFVIWLILCASISTQVYAQYYPLTDPIFVDYLKGVNPSLVDAQDRLIIANAQNENLTIVALNNRNLKNVNGIQYFTSIENLELSQNQIDSIPDLNALTQLKTLNVSHNELDEFNIIANLTSLENLDISNNSIVEFPIIHRNVALTSLKANDNLFERITNFEQALSLSQFDVSNNNLSELQFFDKQYFRDLNEINVAGNLLYFDDYIQTQVTLLNIDNQQKFDISIPSTVYVGNTLSISINVDSDPDNRYVLINKTSGAVMATSTTPTLSWTITSETLSGTYYVAINNIRHANIYYYSKDYFVTVEEAPIITYQLSDNAFIGYLKSLDPTLINTNNELVINNIDNQEHLIFTLNDLGIKNVDGIQFFTSLEQVYLQNNDLTSLPDLNSLTSLSILNLSGNNLNGIQSFPIDNFPNLTQIDIADNQLYYDDFAILPENGIVINKDKQQAIEVSVIDTVLINEVVHIPMTFDSHPNNKYRLVKLPNDEIISSINEAITWQISDTAYSGDYYIDISNPDFPTLNYHTNTFSITVISTEPIYLNRPTSYQEEIIPDGNLDDQTIYIEGSGKATVFNKIGVIYTAFILPHEWNGSDSQGNIIPGHYIIRLENGNIIEVSVIY